MIPSRHTFAVLVLPALLAWGALRARAAAAQSADGGDRPDGDTDAATAPDATAAADAGAPLPALPAPAAAVPALPAPAAVAPPAPPPPAPSFDVTVTGNRPAPRSASAVTRERELLQAAPHRSADELLYLVPGMFVTQHSGEGKAYQIFYRGFDAVHGQDLEVWAGGAPVNDVSNIHGQGYADLHFLPVEIVQQIVATPGTYDPRQGDFAVAGTLRFELGYDQPGITAKAEAGTFDTHRYFLAWHPRTGSEGTFAAAEIYGTQGFGPSRAAQRASAVAQAEIPLDAETTLRVMAAAYTGHFASAGVLRLADLESGAVERFATYDPTQGGASSRTQLVGELRHRDADAAWSLSTFLVLRALRLRQNFTGYLVSVDGDSSQQLNDDLVLGATASYRRHVTIVSPEDAVEAGLYARTDWIEQSQKRLSVVDNRVTADEVDAKVRAHDVAGYLDLLLRPLPRLTLRGGLRLDGLGYFAQDTGGAAAGQARASQGVHVGRKATADLRVLPNLRLLASYGEGFRSPQARALAESETTPFTRVTSFELGARLTGRWVAATLAAFQTRLSDDLVFDQRTTRNERVPATRRTGVTADLTSSPVRWFVAAASATFTDAVFTASDADYQRGDLVPYAPQWVLRLDAAFTPHLGTLHGRRVDGRLGAGSSVLARRPLPYGQWGHDIFLLDGVASVRVGGVAIAVEAYNLLDVHWYDGEFVFASRWDPGAAASLVPQRHVTVGAPRSFLFSLTLSI